MPFYSTAARTRVKWHHKALTASFADATPAMIWRWTREELPAGFVLRHEGGQLHLRQNNSTGGEAVGRSNDGSETTLAVFNNAAAAERALALLSESLLGRFNAWRVLMNILAIVGALTLCFLAYGTLLQHRAATASPGAAALARAPVVAAPAAAPAQPAAPVPGQPVDVDSVYK